MADPVKPAGLTGAWNSFWDKIDPFKKATDYGERVLNEFTSKIVDAPWYKQWYDKISAFFEWAAERVGDIFDQYIVNGPIGKFVGAIIEACTNWIADQLGAPKLAGMEAQANTVAKLDTQALETAGIFNAGELKDKAAATIKSYNDGTTRLRFAFPGSDFAKTSDAIKIDIAKAAYDTKTQTAKLIDHIIETSPDLQGVTLNDTRKAELRKILSGGENNPVDRFIASQAQRFTGLDAQGKPVSQDGKSFGVYGLIFQPKGSDGQPLQLGPEGMKLEEAKSESHKKIAEQLAVYKAADILQANVPADIAKHLVKDGAQVANIARLLKDGSVTADDLKELKKLSADQIAGWAAQLDDSKRTVATQPSMLDMLLSSGQFRGLKVDSDGNALIKLDGNDTPTKVVIPKVTAPQPAAQAAR